MRLYTLLSLDLFWNTLMSSGTTVLNMKKQELDKIQNEAARIATGATKLISLENLQEEVKWQPLQKRGDKHKLTLFFKMHNNITPSYLSDLVPETASSVTRYNLRHSNNIMKILGRTNSYLSLFLPST